MGSAVIQECSGASGKPPQAAGPQTARAPGRAGRNQALGWSYQPHPQGPRICYSLDKLRDPWERASKSVSPNTSFLFTGRLTPSTGPCSRPKLEVAPEDPGARRGGLGRRTGKRQLAPRAFCVPARPGFPALSSLLDLICISEHVSARGHNGVTSTWKPRT